MTLHFVAMITPKFRHFFTKFNFTILEFEHDYYVAGCVLELSLMLHECDYSTLMNFLYERTYSYVYSRTLVEVKYIRV